MIQLTSKEKKLTLFLLLPLYFVVMRYVLSYLFFFVIDIFRIKVDYQLIDPYFNLLFDGSLCLIAVYIYREFIKKSIEQLNNIKTLTLIKNVLLGFCLLYFINILTGILTNLLNPSGSSTNQALVEEMTSIAPIPLLIASILFAPILEEFVFRVGIFNFIYHKSKLLAYLVSSLSFGFLHIYTGLFAGDLSQLLYLIPYGLLGFVFCYLYAKNKNIYVPIVVHMLNNAVSMLLVMLI